MEQELFPPPPEKKCLNCGAVLSGKYCSQCGQKDVPLHEPFIKLAVHFVGDFFHFDSKFFRTLFPLLFKPGFLTIEFVNGRRERYMKPVQLYIFISVVFFLLFFIAATPSVENISGRDKSESIPVRTTMDSVSQKAFKFEEALLDSVLTQNEEHKKQLLKIDSLSDSAMENIKFSISNKEYLPKTVEEYDDSISRLPAGERPNRITQFVTRKAIMASAMNTQDFIKTWVENFFHNLPKLMFLLLPVFALILKLLYIRRSVYLIDHAFFTLHFHSFVFLLFTVVLLLNLFFTIPYLFTAASIIFLVYLIISIHRFYGQPWKMGILKTILLIYLYFTFTFFALLISAAVSAIQL